MNEQQLEAVFECSVKSHGAQWLSFPPVVAGGRRATCLHYIANNRELRWPWSFVIPVNVLLPTADKSILITNLT